MTENKYYSQFGEDEILFEIFKAKKTGVCVEVGGYDGITGSNTVFFERIGWHTLIVEPMPKFCRLIRSTRSCEIAELAASDSKGEVDFFVPLGVETLSTMEMSEKHLERIKNITNQDIEKITVKTSRLDDILLERGFEKIDFITIDVEGHEISVLKGMSFDQIAPRILIIEDNSYGFDRQVKKYMSSKSYSRFRKTGCNDWYAKNDDPLVTSWRIIATEIPIFLYMLKLKIKLVINLFFKR